MRRKKEKKENKEEENTVDPIHFFSAHPCAEIK